MLGGWEHIMTITKLRFDKFTVFEKLDIDLSPGINVFVGAMVQERRI